MPTIGSNSKPAYVYDAQTDTWIPVGPGEHTHDYATSAHNHDSTYIAKTLTTTTGDILYASSANTPARLGIGSSGQVLTVSGGIPSWATPVASDSITLLSTTTLSGVQKVIISPISQDYTHLEVIMQDFDAGSNSFTIYFKLNDINPTRINHTFRGSYATGNYGAFLEPNFSGVSNRQGTIFIRIPFYKTSGVYKTFHYFGGYFTGSSTVGQHETTVMGSAYYESYSTAISSIAIDSGENNWDSGTVKIYGVK